MSDGAKRGPLTTRWRSSRQSNVGASLKGGFTRTISSWATSPFLSCKGVFSVSEQYWTILNIAISGSDPEKAREEYLSGESER